MSIGAARSGPRGSVRAVQGVPPAACARSSGLTDGGAPARKQEVVLRLLRGEGLDALSARSASCRWTSTSCGRSTRRWIAVLGRRGAERLWTAGGRAGAPLSRRRGHQVRGVGQGRRRSSPEPFECSASTSPVRTAGRPVLPQRALPGRDRLPRHRPLAGLPLVGARDQRLRQKFIQTLKEQVLWIERFDTLDELRTRIRRFADDFNEHWLLERHGHRPRGRRARRSVRPRWHDHRVRHHVSGEPGSAQYDPSQYVVRTLGRALPVPGRGADPSPRRVSVATLRWRVPRDA